MTDTPTPPDVAPQAVPAADVRAGDWLALAVPVRITDAQEDGDSFVLTLSDGSTMPPLPAGTEVIVHRAG